MIRLMFVVFVLFGTISFAQGCNSLELKGRIYAGVSNPEGIYVVNARTEKTTVTDENGFFSISAIEGDTLVFSGMQFKRKEIVLHAEDFECEVFHVHVIAVANELNEVIIRNYSNINAASLGIIPFNQKKYTPAERKYATAASYKMNPQGLDPILNLISGRTAMLKKELEVEKKESYIALLEKMFDKEHFIKALKLPIDYIKGFEYFVVENKKFTKILELKNKTTVEFLLGELAIKYLDTIACENE